MRRFASHILIPLLHVFCVLALTMSCGLPEALHELGHTITHSEHPAPIEHAPNTIAAHGSVDSCWLQALVGSVTQFSALGSSRPQIDSQERSAQANLHAPVLSFVSHDWMSWHTSRGPPVV
jgi:hypothetical protein